MSATTRASLERLAAHCAVCARARQFTGFQAPVRTGSSELAENLRALAESCGHRHAPRLSRARTCHRSRFITGLACGAGQVCVSASPG